MAGPSSSSSTIEVTSTRVREATLHTPRPGHRRLDRIIPILLYAVCVQLTVPAVPLSWAPAVCDIDPAEQAEALALVEAEYEAAEEEQRTPYFAAGPRTPEEACTEERMSHLAGPLAAWVTAITVHALAVLACVWSTWFDAKMRYDSAGAGAGAGGSGAAINSALVARGGTVRVVPVEHAGPTEMCPLFMDEDKVHGGPPRVAFRHQKRVYAWDGAKFASTVYPVGLTFGEYSAARGISGASQLAAARETYGENKITIEVPTFKELFLNEHAVAPFFVFQMFCVLLWCLDEYPIYALFTGVMVVVFESTVVFQRLKNLNFIRSMVPPGHNVHVFRDSKWAKVASSDLVPGDLFSLARATGEETVPCDAIILAGTCVVNESTLTGESTPQIKEDASSRGSGEVLDMDGLDRRHVAFGGTSVLQSTPPQRADGAAAGDGAPGGASSWAPPPPPDGGCVAYVMRTGFETSQGGLMKTILFSAERSSANNIEALVFILFLLIFAVAASYHVLRHGLEDRDRSRYRLLLSCTYIITSVVPPELPMELALAVNTSLMALSKLAIFCTEPYRIPLAGKIDVLYFDKTGTLVSENLEVKGIAGVASLAGGAAAMAAAAVGIKADAEAKAAEAKAAEAKARIEAAKAGKKIPGKKGKKGAGDDGDFETDARDAVELTGRDAELVKLIPAKYCPEETSYVLAGCHQLAHVDAELIGDSMEKATLEAADWSFLPDQTASAQSGAKRRLRVLRRFPFMSQLKRSSSIISLLHVPGTPPACRVVVKGAPEVVQSLLREVPADYVDTYKLFARRGARVLALATRDLGPTSASAVAAMERDDAERDLSFAGFLILSSPIKKDSRSTIAQLLRSAHAVVMITGDSPLTACHVSGDLGITDPHGAHLILTAAGGDVARLGEEVTAGDGAEAPGRLAWRSVDEKTEIPFDPSREALARLVADGNALCVTGGAVRAMRSVSTLEALVPHTRIFARFSPTQKETVLSIAKSQGRFTLMCGDGTNDVGALKQAHVGVALLNKGAPQGMVTMDAESREKARRANLRRQLTRVVGDPAETTGRPASMLEARARKMLEELGEEEDDGPKPVALGDASIAAPFVSKSSSPNAVVKLLIEGRRSLVATLQIYRILAVNCLISSYSLSVLAHAGVKLGDTQMTIQGMTIAGVFFAISRSQPAERLAVSRPPSTIFRPAFFLSVLGQFAVHLFCLITVVNLAEEHTVGAPKPKADDSFKPSLVNTVVYLMSNAMMLSSILVNVAGPPHMRSLTKNKGLVYAVAINVGITLTVILEGIPQFNKYMELVTFPETGNFKFEIVHKLLLSFVGSFLWDRFVRRVFP